MINKTKSLTNKIKMKTKIKMKAMKSILKLVFLTTIMSIFMTSCQNEEINVDEELVEVQPDIDIIDDIDSENAINLSKVTYHYKGTAFTPEKFEAFSLKQSFSNVEIVPIDKNTAYVFDTEDEAYNFIGNEFNLDTNNNDFVNQRNSQSRIIFYRYGGAGGDTRVVWVKPVGLVAQNVSAGGGAYFGRSILVDIGNLHVTVWGTRNNSPWKRYLRDRLWKNKGVRTFNSRYRHNWVRLQNY